uniref:WD_REPEATS_REGION domain-containing protein n=1 Tax=Meloidogyne hapla TaxID=6305 RepID=A0A1I8BFW4_MELHA
MDRARRRLASAIDGIRAQFTDADSQEGGPSSSDSAASTIAKIQSMVKERLESSDCRLSRIIRHGFPDGPRCMAFDPVQKLCAIGAARGCVRLLGQGGLITALGDDTLHLWNYRQRIPEIVHSLRMSKESITTIYLPFQSKWLLVGTEKSCPTEPSKILIAFEKGHVVLWNILTKTAERFAAATELSPVTAFCWNSDGRQFMCGHQNGSLSIWNIKKPRELVHKTTPHSPNASSGGGSSPSSCSVPTSTTLPSHHTSCKPITQLGWNINTDGEQLIIFAGGMPMDEGALPSLTVLRAKGSLTVLEMDHAIVEMVPLNNSPYASVAQLPHAIAVLLKNDLLIVDIQAQGYPCFEVPHPMDLHESPVTLLKLENFYSNFKNIKYLFLGGVGRECATGHQEMLLTGHEDGSVKFWQASSEQLQVMYKLKTGRHFEKNIPSHYSAARGTAAAISKRRGSAALDNIRLKKNIAPSHAVFNIEMCLDSRLLMVASCSGQITLFRFSKSDCCQEIAVISLPQLCRSTAQIPSPPSCPPSPSNLKDDEKQPQSTKKRLKQQSGRATYESQQHQRPSRNSSSHSTDTSMGSQQLADLTPLKVRGGALRRPAGYQPELVCQIPWINGNNPERVTALAFNSAYGLAAIGTCVGLALVDLRTASLIYAWHNSELLGRDPIPFWSSLTSQDVTTGPGSPSCSGGEILRHSSTPSTPHNNNIIPPAIITESSPPLLKTSNSSNSSAFPFPSKSLRERLKHQISTQTPPTSVPPPKSPGPLSRGNTTESTGGSGVENNSEKSTNRFLLGTKLQRPQLLKASTFNASAAFDEFCLENSAQQQQESSSINCNGDIKTCIDSHVPSTSSSTESLDKCTDPQQQKHLEEFISSLQFINSCAKKGVTKIEPCLWLGTSLGGALAFQLQLPSNRISSNVVVAPSGSTVRLSKSTNGKNNRLLCIAFMDRDFRLLAAPSESPKNAKIETTSNSNQVQDENLNINKNDESSPNDLQSSLPSNKASKERVGGRGEAKKKWEILKRKASLKLFGNFSVLTKALQSSSMHSSAAQSEMETQQITTSNVAKEEEFLQMAIFVASSEVRAVALPAYRQVFQRSFSDLEQQHPLNCASTTHISGQPALLALNVAGSLLVMSLPSLKSLLECSLMPLSVNVDDRICQRFSFSEHGCGMNMVSNSEVQKFTVSAEIATQVAECMGELFVPCDMPESPKVHSFLRGVVNSLAAVAGVSGNGCSQMEEVDALLSERPTSSTTPNQVRGVARPLLTPQQQQLSSIETGTSRSITAGQAAREAMQNLSERGERLNAVSDATEKLKHNAMNIQSRSAKLLDKYEKKKWYQL